MSSQSSPSTAAQPRAIAALSARLLRLWSAGGVEECAAVADWLEGVAGRLVDGLLEGFELYRRDQWLQYAVGPATVWGRWTGGELERPTYEVMRPASPPGNSLRLRRETPFDAAEASEFLEALAGAEEAGKLQDRKAGLLRGVVVDILYQAACTARGRTADGEDLLGPLQRLHQRHRGEAIRAAGLRRLGLLDQPLPAGLQACLRQLLLPAEEVEGCLTVAYRVRLFRQLAEVVDPLVVRADFTVAEAAVTALRGQVEAQATSAGTLREACARLVELGRFAERARPVLAGPAAGAQRAWLRPLLENFEGVGLLAGGVMGEKPARGQEVDDASTAEPPPVEPGPPREPSPEDAALTALAATSPTAEEFLAMTALAEELQPVVQGCWPEAEEALRGLHYPGNRFRQKLLRAGSVSGEEQQRLIGEAARQLADEFVNKIRRLDALLPGAGSCPPPFKSPAHLAAGARAQLGQRLKALRDRVFQVMRTHGGYDEYPLAVGDSVRKHGQVLDDVTYVSGPRFRPDEIVHILEPGYVRRREDGRQELIRSPKVLVAR
jgi:hypothetical protein